MVFLALGKHFGLSKSVVRSKKTSKTQKTLLTVRGERSISRITFWRCLAVPVSDFFSDFELSSKPG
jgi:hypothetical protein